MTKIIRKVTYKLYPSDSQEESLMDMLIHHHQLYNWALRDRIETYRQFHYGLSFSEQCKINPLWRSNRKQHRLLNANAQSEQVTLKRVSLAFEGFFRRLEQGDRKAGFPRFKPFQRFKGWGYKTHGDGWKLHLKEKKHGAVYLANVGIVKIRGKARNEGGIPKTAEVIRKNGEWLLSVSMEYPSIERKSGTKGIGVDWGVSHYLSTVDHDGHFEQVANPRYLSQSRERMTKLQRDLALVRKGTRHHRKLKYQLAKLHQKIARQRLDFTHKETAKLVKIAALISTEKLTVKNMTRSAKGTADKHGKMVKQKAGLNREILNTAPAMTINFLKYKAEEAGIEWVMVPTQKVKPSQTCPDCGVKKKKTLAERWHSCPCGCEKPRDVASAQVNLNWALGLAVKAGNQPEKVA
ncbi:MAG: RNA-guided endonuclease InsQ/TnpB family protein [Oceanisphaera sp.]